MKFITVLALLLETAAIAKADTVCSNPRGYFTDLRLADSGAISATVRGGSIYSAYSVQPSTIRGYTVQGQVGDNGMTPTEFSLKLSGRNSTLVHRDLTVMGPTKWRLQRMFCR